MDEDRLQLLLDKYLQRRDHDAVAEIDAALSALQSERQAIESASIPLPPPPPLDVPVEEGPVENE